MLKLASPIIYVPVAQWIEHWFAEPKISVRFASGTHLWRGGRVVEGAALEKLYGGNLIVGSNPTLSASSPYSSMDRVAVSGTVDAGSIPAGGTNYFFSDRGNFSSSHLATLSILVSSGTSFKTNLFMRISTLVSSIVPKGSASLPPGYPITPIINSF